MKRLVLSAVLAFAAAGLAACDTSERAPNDDGVCFHRAVVDGQARYNRVGENHQSLEECAFALDALRRKFLGLGGGHREITGAFQGQFLHVSGAGVSLSQSLEGPRFIAFVRGKDGHLYRQGTAPR